MLSAALALYHKKQPVDDEGYITLAPPEELATKFDFMVVTTEGNLKEFPVYMEQEERHKLFDKLKIDVVLEAVNPIEQLQAEFTLKWEAGIANKEPWALQITTYNNG